MRDRIVRVIVPRQVRPRRAGLLARPAAPAPARPALRQLLPRRSSVLGGIDEFPEFREISRSSRAIFSACSAS